MGCPVGLEGRGFRCPCHAGQYDRDGRPVAGPPPRPLEPLDVLVTEAGLILRGAAGSSEVLVRADAVVLATEVRGLQALADASDLHREAPALAAAATASGEADPYSVVRFWFDRPIERSHPAFYTVAGFPWTDGLAAYSAFQHAAMQWAERTGGSIIETHAYAIPPDRQGSLQSYRDALLGELLEVFPELDGARIVHEEAMTQSNFSRFAPGDFARRPTVATDVENLFVAGDHVRLPFPAFLMEAAVASGRLAANHILALDGVLELPIPTVARKGQLAGMI
jgi:isorenieratene synthase